MTLVERSLSDVGVRGGKFYLSAVSENMDIPRFIATGEIGGIKGISSSRYIWTDFSPNAGRDLFMVLDADATLKQNRIYRVNYDNPDALIADNSRLLGRILNISDVAHAPGDNLINGVFDKIPGIRQVGEALRGDMISVVNKAMNLASDQRRAGGLKLNSFDDYAKLYYEAAKEAGWYGEAYVKFFAPQNRSKWLPALRAAVVGQAKVFADESEWSIEGDKLHVPDGTLVVISIPPRYAKDPPVPRPFGWSDYDQKRRDHFKMLEAEFAKSRFKVKIANAEKVANNLVKSRSKQRR